MPQPRTLTDVPTGSSGVLGAPRVTATQLRRLAELGIREGVRVVVLLKTSGGGRVLAVGDDRIALDSGTLRHLPVVVDGVSA